MLSSLIKCVLGAIPYNSFLKIYPKLCKTKLVDFVNEYILIDFLIVLNYF